GGWGEVVGGGCVWEERAAGIIGPGVECRRMFVRMVDVGHGQRAGGRRGLVLAHAAGMVTADRGRVVGAVDGDGDELAGGAVGAGDRKSVGGGEGGALSEGPGRANKNV